ncbi:hypothetical protein I6H07_06225 [Hafnia alvei]|nr:hypothetical protein [Hafnia alvei]MBI0275431.1 hypothetical protein [Hafnia alvei]
MAFKTATQNSGNAASVASLLDAGGYAARIVQIIDLGLQPGSQQYPEPVYKLLVKFELLDEFMHEVNEDGSVKVTEEDSEMVPVIIADKPRWFDFEFTYNEDGYMGDRSHIYKLMQAVDAFEVVANPDSGVTGHPAKELKELLGEPLMLNLIQTIAKGGKNAGKTVNKISSFAAMKGKDKKTAPALVNPTTFFDMAEPDIEVFSKLPSGNQYCPQERIKSGPAFGQSKLAAMLGLASAKPIVVEEVAEPVDVDEAMAAELAAQQAAQQASAVAEKPAVPF